MGFVFGRATSRNILGTVNPFRRRSSSGAQRGVRARWSSSGRLVKSVPAHVPLDVNELGAELRGCPPTGHKKCSADRHRVLVGAASTA